MTKKELKKRFVAKEVPAEKTDFSWYFEGDTYTEAAGGIEYTVFIMPTRDHSGFNREKLQEIVNEAERLIDNYEELIEDGELTGELAKWVKEKYESEEGDSMYDTYNLIDYLEVTTGKKWKSDSFTGYSQGDYCEIVYCPEANSTEAIECLGKFWLGCGAEFEVLDTEDIEAGYCNCYVIDTVRWEEGEELKNELATQIGCNPEELEVQLCVDSHTVYDYKILD